MSGDFGMGYALMVSAGASVVTATAAIVVGKFAGKKVVQYFANKENGCQNSEWAKKAIYKIAKNVAFLGFSTLSLGGSGIMGFGVYGIVACITPSFPIAVAAGVVFAALILTNSLPNAK